MKRLRVEPYSSYLERRRKGPIYPVTLAGGYKSPTNICFRDKISANIRALGEWLFRLPKRADGPLNQEHRKPWPDFLHSR